MLDASNPDGSKAKKPKNQNRPVQRFWPENIATMAQKGQLSKQVRSTHSYHVFIDNNIKIQHFYSAIFAECSMALYITCF